MPLYEFSSQMTIAFNPAVSSGFSLVLMQPLPTAASTGGTNKWKDCTSQGTSTSLFKNFTVPMVSFNWRDKLFHLALMHRVHSEGYNA